MPGSAAAASMACTASQRPTVGPPADMPSSEMPGLKESSCVCSPRVNCSMSMSSTPSRGRTVLLLPRLIAPTIANSRKKPTSCITMNAQITASIILTKSFISLNSL